MENSEVGPLRISSIAWPYLVEWVTPSKLAGKIGGYFDAVATSLNVSYTLRMPADWQWGTCELDGSACTGMLGDTFYNNSDISFGPFSPMPVYSELFHRSNPIGFETFTVVTGTQVAYAVNTFSTFTGIEGIVYLLLLILPLSIAVLVAVNARWILPRIEQEDNTPVTLLFLNLIRLNVQNASDIRVKSASNRLLITGYMIASLFTAIMVSSSIKATMMRRDPTERMKTFGDLLRHKHRLNPICPPKNFLTDVLEAEESGEIHDLYQWIKAHGFVPVQELVSLDNVRGILNGTSFIFLNCDSTGIILANTYFALPEKHRGYLICLEQHVFTTPSVWYFKKTLPLRLVKEFNKRIQWIFEAPTKFVYDFKYPHVPLDRFARSTSLSGDAVMEALSVDETIGCFYVLAAGTSAAFIALLFEKLISVFEPMLTMEVQRII